MNIKQAAAIELAAATILSQIWEAVKHKCETGEGIGRSLETIVLTFSVSIVSNLVSSEMEMERNVELRRVFIRNEGGFWGGFVE